MAKKKMSLAAYKKTAQDKREDTRNAKKRGISVAAWKKTPLATKIDKRDLAKKNKK